MGKGQRRLDCNRDYVDDSLVEDYVHVHKEDVFPQKEEASTNPQQSTDSTQILITPKGKRSLFSEVQTVLAVCTLSFIFCILAPSLTLGWVLLPWTHGISTFTIFFILYTITQWLPPFYSRSFKDGPLHAPIIRGLADYLTECQVVKECQLDPTKNYVFAWHPHGRMFYGFGMLVGLFSSWFPEITKSGHDIFGGVNDLMFRIPFVSNWLHLVGLIECNKHSINKKLKAGDSVGLIVGGIEEVLEGTFDDKDVLYLKNRKGFAKLAMDHGSGVVPCFCFGENSLFMHESESTLNFWRWMNKFAKFGAPLPIKGWMGTPFPIRVPMLIAIGKPLFAVPGESVDAFHSRYMVELEKLHAKYVRLSNQPDRKLVIV